MSTAILRAHLLLRLLVFSMSISTYISTFTYIKTGQKKIFNFNHIDYYFWISFAIILDFTKWMLWFLFIIIGVKMIGRFKTRINHLSKLDKDKSF